MDALTTSHIWYTYTGSNDPVLQDLTLNIPRGAVTAVMGPNGCGKTTLLCLFVGLMSPDKGDIRFLGRSYQTCRRGMLKRHIGLVPQNETIPFDLSLIEYVLLGRAPFLHLLQQPRKADETIAMEAIQTVGLARFSRQPVPTLSSGERQLASIARVLTQTPDIMLLDEPTSHLDLGNSRRILRLMRSISKQDSTVLFTTHDPNAAAVAADFIVMIGNEGLVAAGETERVLTEGNLSKTYSEKVEVAVTRRGPVVLTFS